jgi:cyclin-dependent kinase 2
VEKAVSWVGAYGMVYKCLDKEENKPVALKRIKMEVEESGIPLTALREIVFLRKLDHPNIVKLENVVMDSNRLYLVFELLDMDLKRYFDTCKQPLDTLLIQSYAAQLLEGIAYCHSTGIMHRYLRPR